MKQIKDISKLLVLVCIYVLFASWNTKYAYNVIAKSSQCGINTHTCTMDIYSQNNTPVVVDYVKFESSLDTKINSNIAANGGNGDAGNIFEWITSEGFELSVKLRAYPGTGSIRVFDGVTQIACLNFTNQSTSIVYSFLQDFSGNCYGGILVFIETYSC